MAQVVDRHGTEFTLNHTGSCFCTKCGEMFNSRAAFDHHLRYRKAKKRFVEAEGAAKHLDPEKLGMARNARGLWVTALMPQRTYG